MPLFIDPNGSFECNADNLGEVFYIYPKDTDGLFQLIFLASVYGVILFKSSTLIAEGSDLLMLIVNPGLVGGLVLPVLGALPDGAVVLYSGLGDSDSVQRDLQIGIGTLAGSTIMLLTIPWFLATWYGRVDLTERGGVARYTTKLGTPKLTMGNDLHRTGTTPSKDIAHAAKVMLASGCIYLVIQGPSFRFVYSSDVDAAEQAESIWALVAFILSLLGLVVYSVYQVTSANAKDNQKNTIQAIRGVAFRRKIVDLAFLVTEDEIPVADEDTPLKHYQSQVEGILQRNFVKYDVDESGTLNRNDIQAMFASLHITLEPADLNHLIDLMDTDGDGEITFEDYRNVIIAWVKDPHLENVSDSGGDSGPEGVASYVSSGRSRIADIVSMERQFTRSASPRRITKESSQKLLRRIPQYEDDYEQDEEVEYKSMTPRQIKVLSAFKLTVGIATIALFADAMCDTISCLSSRMGVSSFYISFFIVPFVSNASELVSAIYFGKKKTQKSITVSYSTLLGAATLNNTFVLSIFLGIIYFRELEWDFSAEVMGILFVEAVMFVLCLAKTITLYRSLIVLSLFPISLLLIASLKFIGWK